MGQTGAQELKQTAISRTIILIFLFIRTRKKPAFLFIFMHCLQFMMYIYFLNDKMLLKIGVMSSFFFFLNNKFHHGTINHFLLLIKWQNERQPSNIYQLCFMSAINNIFQLCHECLRSLFALFSWFWLRLPGQLSQFTF